MSFYDLDEHEKENRFNEELTSFENGNYRDFIDFLDKLKGEDILLLIRYIQDNEVKNLK